MFTVASFVMMMSAMMCMMMVMRMNSPYLVRALQWKLLSK